MSRNYTIACNNHHNYNSWRGPTDCNASSMERYASSSLNVPLMAFAVGVIMSALVAVVGFAYVKKRSNRSASVGPSSPSNTDTDTIDAASVDATALRAKVVQAIFPQKVVEHAHDHGEEQGEQEHPSEHDERDVECGNNNREFASAAECPICIEGFKEGDIVATSLCSHCFHRDCILGWSQIKTACPMCRQAMWDPKQYVELEREILKL